MSSLPRPTPHFLRPLSHRFALESRQLFDGAAFVEAAAAATDAAHAPGADHHAEAPPPPPPAPLAPPVADATPSATPHAVYAVDASVANWQQIVGTLPPGSEVIVLQSNADGATQLAAALEGRSDVSSLSIISHGATGQITLGSSTVTADNIAADAAAWQRIGSSLTADGDILLYGCDVAQQGDGLLQRLSSLTGADVAASTNATGAARLGGDWTLEATVGTIEAATLVASGYDDLLAAPTIDTTATRLAVAEPSPLAPGAEQGQLTGWTITDDGPGNVTVTALVDSNNDNLPDGTVGTLSVGAAGARQTSLTFTGTASAAQAWLNGLYFQAADVELGNTAASAFLRVTVTDAETPALSATRSLAVSVTPSNDPTTVADASQAIAEIGTTTLLVSTLDARDPEVDRPSPTQIPSQIVYSVTAAPQYGYLQLGSARLGVGSVFTQQDVISGNLRYVHLAVGANQNTPDGFDVRVNDGATPNTLSDVAHVTLNVTALNQAPTVSGSGSVFEGQPFNAANGASAVGNFITATGGGDDTDAELSVRLTSLPADGTLFFSGTALVNGVATVFTNHAVTALDVSSGFSFAYTARAGLTYSNFGNRDNGAGGYPFQDNFGVVVPDSGGGTSPSVPASTASTNIAINVRAVNDDPVWIESSTRDATVTAAGQGGAYRTTFTTAMLNMTDVDSSNAALTFAVTSQADLLHGRILLNGQVLPLGGTFTLADVAAGRVQYEQRLGAGGDLTDTFRFEVVDNTVDLRWNADGTPVQRPGGVYNDNGTPGNYSDDTPRDFTFTIHLEQTGPGTGGSMAPLDSVTSFNSSNYAGVNPAGGSVGAVLEGGTIGISGTPTATTPGLSYTVSGVAPTQVVYTVLGFDGNNDGTLDGDFNGALQRQLSPGVWVDLTVYDTFTQAELNNGNIRFAHDGDSEDFSSSVRLSASAGVLVNGVPDARIVDFAFFVTPTNDAPTVTGSSSTVIREGEIAYITTGQLTIGDPDDAASEAYAEASPTLPTAVLGDANNYAYNNDPTGADALKFVVNTLPPGGTLEYLNAGVWTAVTAGLELDASVLTASAGTTGLRFVSSGAEVSVTAFTVSAIDRWNRTSPTPGIVAIDITSVNDAPAIASRPDGADPTIPTDAPNNIDPSNQGPQNNPLTVAEGGNGRITSGLLQAYDPDSTSTQVQYRITSAPQFGDIVYTADGGLTYQILGVNSSFTQADIEAGRIYYVHDGVETGGGTYPSGQDDKFTFTLSDGDKEQAGNEFWIYVTPANDKPVVVAPVGPIGVGAQNGVDNRVAGFVVSDPDLLAPTAGETDFLEVTVRLLDNNGVPFSEAQYTGVTLAVASVAGLTVVNTHGDPAPDYLTLRGTRAQINTALAGLTVSFANDRDALYRVEVIADDRLRNPATGALLGGANGGPGNDAITPGANPTAIVATEYDWFTATVPTGPEIIGNISSAAVTIRASSENDAPVLSAGSPATVFEDQATLIGPTLNLTISDAESLVFGSAITVTLQVPGGQGTLLVGSGNGVFLPTGAGTFGVTISGFNTGTLTLVGRASDIDLLLRQADANGLRYLSPANGNQDYNAGAAGDVTLQVTVNDGLSAIGDVPGSAPVANEAIVLTTEVALTITAVNDAPSVTLGAGLDPDVPLFLTSGAVPSPVPGFVVNDVDTADGLSDGEIDFLQVTVRVTSAAGVPLDASYYGGVNGNVTIESGTPPANYAGLTVDTTFTGVNSALVIRGTRAQVQAYLDGLELALTGNLANGDQGYRLQVIADDRLRAADGTLAGTAANGGQNNNPAGGTSPVPTTAVSPYTSSTADLTALQANVRSQYRTVFPSAINDPAHINGTNMTAAEGSATYTLSGLAISDQDAASDSVLTTTVTVPAGYVISGVGAGIGGNASAVGGQTLTLTGTLAQINSRINTIVVTLPDVDGAATAVTAADWNGSFNVTIQVDDEGNTGARPGSLAPGDNNVFGTYAYQDTTANVDNDLLTTRTLTVTVTPVNDAPVLAAATPASIALPAPVAEDVAAGSVPGSTVGALFSPYYTDAADNIGNGGSVSDGFYGVAITGVTPNPAQGAWQYSLNGGTTWIAVGARTDATALVLDANAQLRFVPAANFHGTPNALTVRLVETDANNDSPSADPTPGTATPANTTTNGGSTLYSAGTIALTTSVVNVNDRPTGTDGTLAAGVEDQLAGLVPTATVTSLFGTGYSDTTDNQTAIAGGANAATALGGIAIVGNASTAGQGTWQYTTDNVTWTDVPAGASDAAAVLLPASAQLRFVPAANFNGTPGGLTVRLSDAPVAASAGSNIAATVNDATSQWSTVHNLATVVAPRNDAPTIGGTTGNHPVTENPGLGTGVPPVQLVGAATIADLDIGSTPGVTVFGQGSITVSLGASYLPGDELFVAAGPALPPGFVVTGGTGGTSLVIGFDADTTTAEIAGVMERLSWRSTSDNPTNYGAVGANQRTYTIVVNDGNNQQAGGNAGGTGAADPTLNSNTLSGTITITPVDDLPVANNDANAAVEDGPPVTGNVIANGSAGDVADTDPDNLVTDLRVSAIRTGTEASGTGTPGTPDGSTPLPGSYGSLVINANGSYSYTVNNTDPRVQALVAGETLTETYTYTVSDGAGGVDTAQLVITINGAANGGAGDDVPGIAIPDTNGAATGQLTVFEAGLTSTTDARETNTSTLTLNAADGIGSLAINGTTVTLAQLQTLGGATTIVLPDTGKGVLTLTGFTPTTTVGGIVTAATVSYSYTLTQPQDHTAGAVTDAIALVVTDRDGDPANGTLTVFIVDDAPVAQPDVASITEDAAPNTVSGNVRTNDALGADNGNTVPVTAVNGTPGLVGTSISTSYGSIVLNANGTYTYTLDNNNATVNALRDGDVLTETVQYTVTDADGDPSSATLTITINGHTDAGSGPTIVPVAGNGAAIGQP
ncbi:MAG: cadherin-like domain-containing protein [Variovorax sp.]